MATGYVTPALAPKVVVDPVARIEGHIGAEVQTSGVTWSTTTTGAVSGTVVNATTSVEMYRGYENILKGRHPGDALHITQRI